MSLVLIPSLVGQYLGQVSNPTLASAARSISQVFNPAGLAYNLLYFFLIIGFSYFYTAVIFNPTKIADEIQKYGGFIPGIRPGQSTANYLNYILTRITLAGAVFLGLIAVLPSFATGLTNIATLTIGGTGALIVVSVILETTRQFETMMVTKSYDKFTR